MILIYLLNSLKMISKPWTRRVSLTFSLRIDFAFWRLKELLFFLGRGSGSRVVGSTILAMIETIKFSKYSITSLEILYSSLFYLFPSNKFLPQHLRKRLFLSPFPLCKIWKMPSSSRFLWSLPMNFHSSVFLRKYLIWVLSLDSFNLWTICWRI